MSLTAESRNLGCNNLTVERRNRQFLNYSWKFRYPTLVVNRTRGNEDIKNLENTLHQLSLTELACRTPPTATEDTLISSISYVGHTTSVTHKIVAVVQSTPSFHKRKWKSTERNLGKSLKCWEIQPPVSEKSFHTAIIAPQMNLVG